MRLVADNIFRVDSMAKKRTARCVSIRTSTYKLLSQQAKAEGKTMTAVVEDAYVALARARSAPKVVVPKEPDFQTALVQAMRAALAPEIEALRGSWGV